MKEKFKDSALSPKERAEDLLPRLIDLLVSQSSTLMLLHSTHGYHSC